MLFQVDVKEGAVSLYVALFDYTPSIMSPNNESYQDELAFVESQLIKVGSEHRVLMADLLRM